MRFVCAVLYYVALGLITWVLWVAGKQIPLGIGDVTMGHLIVGLMVGSGVLMLKEFGDGKNTR